MKAAELRKLSQKERQDMLTRLLREQLKLRITRSQGELTKFNRFAEIRRIIARIKTVEGDGHE